MAGRTRSSRRDVGLFGDLILDLGLRGCRLTGVGSSNILRWAHKSSVPTFTLQRIDIEEEAGSTLRIEQLGAEEAYVVSHTVGERAKSRCTLWTVGAVLNDFYCLGFHQALDANELTVPLDTVLGIVVEQGAGRTVHGHCQLALVAYIDGGTVGVGRYSGKFGLAISTGFSNDLSGARVGKVGGLTFAILSLASHLFLRLIIVLIRGN